MKNAQSTFDNRRLSVGRKWKKLEGKSLILPQMKVWSEQNPSAPNVKIIYYSILDMKAKFKIYIYISSSVQ